MTNTNKCELCRMCKKQLSTHKGIEGSICLMSLHFVLDDITRIQEYFPEAQIMFQKLANTSEEM